MAELKDSKCDANPAGVNVKVANGGKIEKAGSYYTYTLPGVSGGVDALGLSRLNSKRSSAVEIKYPVDETCEYTLELDGLKAVTKSKTASVRNSAGSVEMSISVSGDKVTVKRSIKLNKSVFAPAELKDLQALLAEWNSASWKKLILK